MTQITETTEAGALSAGVDLSVPPPTMSDIRATAAELLAHIEDIHMSTEGSLLLKNARSAVVSAVQYIESHLAECAMKARGEVAAVEARLEEPLSSTDAAAIAGLII